MFKSHDTLDVFDCQYALFFDVVVAIFQTLDKKPMISIIN